MAMTTFTRRTAWEKTYTEYQSLNHKLAQAEGPDVDRLERAVAAQQDELLDLPAPSIAAVIAKLSILWEIDLEKPDQDGRQKALVIEDLQDLSCEAAALIGASA